MTADVRENRPKMKLDNNQVLRNAISFPDGLLERSASRKVGSLNRFIILRADSSLELMQDTQTEPDSGEEADRSSSVSMEDLAWSRRVSGSLRACGLRRDGRFETAQLGRE